MESYCCCNISNSQSNDEPSQDITVDDISGHDLYQWNTWDLFEGYLLDLERQNIIRIEDGKKIMH